MHRIDTATKAPDLFGAGKDGFKDGDKALGISATELTAAFFNDIQENIAQLVEAGGDVLVKGDYSQLRLAIAKMFGVSRFSASGTFIVPAGVTTVYLTGCGAGGGGGAYSGANGAGGGGAGASCLKRSVAVTPGQSITVTIGQGGAGGAIAGAVGSNGGTTSFGALCSLGGGGGGASVAAGGGGGSASGGTGGATIAGLQGEQYNPRGTTSGGMGGSSAFGVGGYGGGTGTSNQAGSLASGFGSGGGGGASAGGGAGSSGFLLVEWGN